MLCLEAPDHVTPFVQIGGRARMAESEYAILVPAGEGTRKIDKLKRCGGGLACLLVCAYVCVWGGYVRVCVRVCMR